MIPAPVMAFFSMPDTVLILVIALLLFGPKNLPKMARGIGKSMEEFRRAAREIETEIMKEPEPTTPPPPPPPPASETPALTEGTPESEHHYGETGEGYPDYGSESSTETTAATAPVVVSDTPVTLPSAAAPVVVAEAAATPAIDAAPVAATPAAAPVAAAPVTAPAQPAALAAAPAPAVPANPPTEKKTDVTPAA